MNEAYSSLSLREAWLGHPLGWLSRWRTLQYAVGFCLFEVGYYVAYHFGMSFSQACAAPFWFPDSVLLGALLLARPKQWWALVLGTLPIRLLVDVPPGAPLWFLLGVFAVDSAKGLLGAVLLRRLIRNPMWLETVKEFGFFCLFAVFLVPALAAFGGAALRQGLGFDYWDSWEQWFMSNVSTQLVVTPALFYLVLGFPWSLPASTAKRLVEGIFVISALIVTSYFAFSGTPGDSNFEEPRFYAPVIFLFWAALRFGMAGASGAITILAIVSVEAALQGRGPFSTDSPGATAFSLQQFLLLRAAPLYLVAILIEQGRGHERSLRLSEALNRNVIDSLASYVIILDRSGCIIAANQAWREAGPLNCFSSASADVGGNYLEICRQCGCNGDPSATEALDGIESVLSGGQDCFQIEYRCLTPQGQRWFEMQAAPFRGELGGVVVKHRDITDRKIADAEAAELRQELAHASRVTMLGQLTSSLAHELSQPLGAILRNAEAAECLLEADQPDLDELRAIVTDIRKDDRRAGDVIDRLRALLKRREFEPQVVSLRELADEVVTLTRSDAATRRVEITLALPDDLPLVRADRIHLQQVMLNLLMNGMEALSQAGQEDGAIWLQARRNGDAFVEFTVRDNGPGIPPEKLAMLFTPFFTTKSQGMGLGLSISRTMVESHSGRIWAENNAARGAAFHFTVPVAS